MCIKLAKAVTNMKYTESACVNCDLPCIYNACPNYEVTIYKCDSCGEENVALYELNGLELCIECVKKQLPVVEGSDVYDY